MRGFGAGVYDTDHEQAEIMKKLVSGRVSERGREIQTKSRASDALEIPNGVLIPDHVYLCHESLLPWSNITEPLFLSLNKF